jgi:electron transfer flavoprotein beta subunit
VGIVKILACYKCVPDEQDIAINADKTLAFKSADYKIGAYDLNAVEAAMKLAEGGNATVAVLTVGAAEVDNSKLKKAILSRGPAEMYGITDAALAAADSYTTAKALQAGIAKIADVRLVLCGEGSGDMYSQQVGSILGGLLGWNTVNGVSAVSVNGDTLIVERTVEDGLEQLEVDLPAVLSVTSDINTPRIAGMKDILAAGKKPQTVWQASEAGANTANVTQTASILAPEQAERKQVIISGDGEAEIAELAEHLRKLV